MKLSDMAVDARQSKEWGVFLTQIGWEYLVIEKTHVFLRTLPYINRSIIKIQHPKGPIPYQKIHALAKKRKALFVVIEPHIAGFTEQAFLQNAYSISKLRFAHSATILLDLRKSTDELWRSFSENARRNIRKAQKQVTIKKIYLKNEKDESRIQEFYSLYSQLGKQKKFYVPSYHEVRAKISAFRKSSVFLYAYENADMMQPIAVLWVGAVKNSLIYFHPGNTEKGYTMLANYLLVWEALLLGKSLGLSVFDFETAYDPRYPGENAKWKGYTAFKKKFGGEFVSFPSSYIKFYNPVFKSFYLLATMFSRE